MRRIVRSGKHTPLRLLQEDMIPRNSFDRLEKEYPRSKSCSLAELTLGERLPTDYMGDFAAGEAFSRVLLSDNTQLIMLTQNSKTD